MIHRCNAIGCTWATERRLVMCLTHWTKLPAPLQNAIWATYKAVPADASRARNIPYMTACAEGVEYLARLEKRPEVNSYRRAVSLLETIPA